MRFIGLLLVFALFPLRALASGETISPNMSLTIPGVGVTVGPDWADDINVSLGIIDQHDHSPGNGVKINPSGININSDLSFNNTNVSLPRSIRYTSQGAPLALANDLSCSYVSSGDLYFNDGSGNQIRITQGGALAGAAGTITGLPSGTASVAYASSQGTFVFQQATSTAANMDIGTLLLRYPGSYPTPAGNFIALEAPTSLASAYALTFPNSTPGSSGSYLTASTAGILSYTTADQSGQAMTSVGANAIGQTMTSTGANAVANTRTRSAANPATAGNFAKTSASSGAFTMNSTTAQDVPNLSVTLTTSGRPVWLGLMSSDDPLDGFSYVQSSVNAGETAEIRFVDTSDSHSVLFSQWSGNKDGAQSTFVFVGAGTYTWKVTLRTNTPGLVVGVSYFKFVAYEL